jgi:hypothetical protein
MKTSSNNFLFSKIIIWFLIPFVLLSFNLVAGFNGLYGQDSFEYLRYSRALHEYLAQGTAPGTFFWPILYPLTGAIVSFILPDVLALQVVSIASYGMTIFFLQKILLHLYSDRNREISLYLFLLFSISPFVLLYSSFVMSDSLTMFLLSAFFYYWFLYNDKGDNRHFILLVFFAFTAINTRYASIAVVFLPGMSALYRFIRNFNLTYFLISVLIAIIVFIPNIVLEIRRSQTSPVPILIPDWSVNNFFHRTFFTLDGHQSYTFPNLCFVFSNTFNPGYLFIGLFFNIYLKIKTLQRPFFQMVIIVIVTYALFLAGLPTQNSRFLLITFPLVILLYSGPFLRCLDLIHQYFNSVCRIQIIKKSKKMILIFMAVSVFLIQIALFYRAFTSFYKDSRTIKEIALRLKSYPGKTIYTFNIDQGLKAYDVKNEIINLWSDRINNFKPGSFILFNYVNSNHQWRDTNPMYNWEKVNKEYKVSLIEMLPGGWNLYEIKN